MMATNGLKDRTRRGLTVLELLVSIGIVSVLMALLLPAVHSARESSRRIQCQNNMRQMGMALHQHHETIGSLPRGWTQNANDAYAVGWATQILPWLEQSTLQDRVATSLRTGLPSDIAAGDSCFNQTPNVFICPSDSAEPVFRLYMETEDDEAELSASSSDGVLMQLPHANYVGIFGTTDPDELTELDGGGTFIAAQPIRFRDLTNGLSHVAVVSERTARRLPSTWLGFHLQGEDAAGRVLGFASFGPNHRDADECEFDSRHPNCINMLFADGHVQVVADGIDSDLYRSMARRY